MKVSHLKHLRAHLHYYWYLYSPTLLDSQELFTFCLPHALQLVMLLSPVTTILPKLRGSPMENGDADWSSLAARAVDQDLLLWRNSTVFFNGDGEASPLVSYPQLGQLLLCFGKGGFLQWRMENVVEHLRPGCLGRWVSPCFTSVLGGQCSNGDDNGRRK